MVEFGNCKEKIQTFSPAGSGFYISAESATVCDVPRGGHLNLMPEK